MISRRLTLLSDGPFDRALMANIAWLERRVLPRTTIVHRQWADFRALPAKPNGLAEKISTRDRTVSCDLLVVHRDSETPDPAHCFAEIGEALVEANCAAKPVAVVPVRMTEAWLLFDHNAIRLAAGNPNGKSPLYLPKTAWDELPDPKSVLHGSAAGPPADSLGDAGRSFRSRRRRTWWLSTLPISRLCSACRHLRFRIRLAKCIHCATVDLKIRVQHDSIPRLADSSRSNASLMRPIG